MVLPSPEDMKRPIDKTARRRVINRVCANKKARLGKPGMTMCLRPTADNTSRTTGAVSATSQRGYFDKASPCVFIRPPIMINTSTPVPSSSYQSASPSLIWNALFAAYAAVYGAEVRPTPDDRPPAAVAHLTTETVNEVGVGAGIDVDHATVNLQWHVENRRRVSWGEHMVTDQHVDIEAADRVLECLIGCRCAQIAYGRAHFNTELLPQFVCPRVKFIVEHVDQDQI